MGTGGLGGEAEAEVSLMNLTLCDESRDGSGNGIMAQPGIITDSANTQG